MYMENQRLKGKKVAILATNGVDSIELQEVRKALNNAGAMTVLISFAKDPISTTKTEEMVPVEAILTEVSPKDFDAVFLPGGLKNSDKLRTKPEVIEFIKEIGQTKPVAAICHGPWLLINAGLVKGKKVTSYPSLQADLENAGAIWVNESVIKDGNVITSRRPDDVIAFSSQLVDLLAQE